MHFAGRIIRPPYEARSKFLQITTGCSHNKCKFCTYYDNVPFTISPKNEIIEDLEELRDNSYSFKRIWLQGADPFTLSADKLCEVASLIHEYLPYVQSIGAYARVDSIKNKSVNDLIRLKEAGYKSIAFGIESGDDKLLTYMDKGYTSEDIVRELSKMDEAGLSYTVIFLSGLGGHSYGSIHAEKTAHVINHLNPERVMVTGLTIFENARLNEDIQKGNFIEANERERILELIDFLEKLEVDTFIDASHASVTTPFFGKVPESKNAMIQHLKEIYEENNEKNLHDKRERLNKI